MDRKKHNPRVRDFVQGSLKEIQVKSLPNLFHLLLTVT